MAHAEIELVHGRAVSDAFTRLSSLRLDPTSGQRAAVASLPGEARRAATVNPPGAFLTPSHR